MPWQESWTKMRVFRVSLQLVPPHYKIILKCRGGYWTSWHWTSFSRSLPLFLPVISSQICWDSELELLTTTSLSGWKRLNIKEYYLHSICTPRTTKCSKMPRWVTESSVLSMLCSTVLSELWRNWWVQNDAAGRDRSAIKWYNLYTRCPSRPFGWCYDICMQFCDKQPKTSPTLIAIGGAQFHNPTNNNLYVPSKVLAANTRLSRLKEGKVDWRRASKRTTCIFIFQEFERQLFKLVTI